ncbi:hypothetical protein ACP4OV_009412 [Aristida adscensionis]
MASARAWVVAAAVAAACLLLMLAAGPAEAGGSPPAPPAQAAGGSLFGCNPLTDKTCKVGSIVDMDGDGIDDEDEIPMFNSHLNILGH